MTMLKVLLICAFLGAGAALSCRWMEHKYGEYRDSCFSQLNAMANNSINSSGDGDLEAFPNELYSQASRAVAEERLRFVVQLLEEVFELFDNQTCASWPENAMDDFLNIITQQKDGLRSCISSQSHKRKKNKKLNLYFKRLTTHVQGQTSHKAEAWEWIRKQVKLHLQRSDMLVLTKTN